MKANIICPKCIEWNRRAPRERRRKPQVLGCYEDVIGRGDLYLFCKKCHEEIHIRIAEISLDR